MSQHGCSEFRRPLTDLIQPEAEVAPPDRSFAPWQVAAAVGILVLVLIAAILLAKVHPLALSALVPILAASRRLIPRLLLSEQSQSATGDRQ